MMPKIRHSFLLITATALLSLTSLAQQSTPKAAVESFYKFDSSHSQVFNRANIDARKAWFAPELYNLFQNELRREAAYLKKNPTDKLYFGDGLPFRPYDEVCNAGGKNVGRGLTVKQEFIIGSRAITTASFAYPKACTEAGDPVVYTIGLIKANGRWVIDDVNYGEDTTLKQRLKRTEY
jgi:hypothetical protein